MESANQVLALSPTECKHLDHPPSGPGAVTGALTGALTGAGAQRAADWAARASRPRGRAGREDA